MLWLILQKREFHMTSRQSKTTSRQLERKTFRLTEWHQINRTSWPNVVTLQQRQKDGCHRRQASLQVAENNNTKAGKRRQSFLPWTCTPSSDMQEKFRIWQAQPCVLIFAKSTNLQCTTSFNFLTNQLFSINSQNKTFRDCQSRKFYRSSCPPTHSIKAMTKG